MSNYSPILARLLATENLTVMQSNVSTACFDVENRVLKIPNLLPKYDGAYGMLTAHEVGHALFTTREFNNIFLAASNTMRQYYNICEDVRVEKLIKRKYPGLRRVMAEGYEIFNSNNYFLPPDVDVNSLTLIDRINAYFKVGHFCRVDFNREEQLLAEEVENAETVDEVITVAKKIFALAKQQLTKPKQEDAKPKLELKDIEDGDDGMITESDDDESQDGDDQPSAQKPQEDSDGDESGDEEADDSISNNAEPGTSEELDDDVDNESNVAGDQIDEQMSDEEIESKLQSKTQNALDDGFKDAADMKTEVLNLTLETNFAKDPIYSYKFMLKNMTDDAPCYYDNVGVYLRNKTIDFDKFMSSTNRVVSHMVKEFEMKKCAHKQRRAQVSRTGQLNVNKLFAYKIKDELFKSITTIADDKNHGMVFLVDWSGSMSQHLHDTLCQLISLAMFCRKAQIPFSVLAFTNDYHNENMQDHVKTSRVILRRNHEISSPNDTLMSGAGYDLQLLELLSDKMNEREFTRMLKLLHGGVVDKIYSLSSTPLDASLVYMHSYVAKYKKSNNIEKLTFVVLTDGESDSIEFKSSSGQRTIQQTYRYGTSTVSKIIDPITKHVHDITYRTMTRTLLTMIKNSAHCQVIGFYVCRSRDINSALNRNLGNDLRYGADDAAKSDFRKNGYSVLKNCGYDKLYLVNSLDLGESEYIPNYNEDMSASVLAKEMSKQNSTSVSNKMLMGRVIGEFSIGISV